jgi:hypothetical protein
MAAPRAEDLGKLIVVRDGQGGLKSVGKAIAYCDHPTVIVEMTNGTRIQWAAHLCEVLTLADDVVEQLTTAT